MENDYLETILGESARSYGMSTLVKRPGSAVTTRDDATNALVTLGVGTVGAVIGAVFWKNHRVLGTLAGLTAGGVAGALAAGKHVTALGYIASEAAAVGLSLKWKKHPALGYLGGKIAGTALTALAAKGR